MLALTRKKGETIIIGENIEITVVDMQNDQVKLAIKAPKEITIYRKEIYLQIQEENKNASQISEESIQKLKEFF